MVLGNWKVPILGTKTTRRVQFFGAPHSRLRASKLGNVILQSALTCDTSIWETHNSFCIIKLYSLLLCVVCLSDFMRDSAIKTRLPEKCSIIGCVYRSVCMHAGHHTLSIARNISGKEEKTTPPPPNPTQPHPHPTPANPPHPAPPWEEPSLGERTRACLGPTWKMNTGRFGGHQNLGITNHCRGASCWYKHVCGTFET